MRRIIIYTFSLLFSYSVTLSAQERTSTHPGAAAGQAQAGQTVPLSRGTNQIPVVITITQAIDLARKNNPSLQASATLIQQSKAEEITANLRPNPVLFLDGQFLPLFNSSRYSAEYFDTTAQFDVGVGYLFERGGKRQRRLQAVKDQTAVTESQVADAERILTESTAQQFVAVLLANSNLEFAIQSLDSYQKLVASSEEKHKTGNLRKADLVRIQLQALQLRTDVKTARIAKVQALAILRQLVGYDSVPRNYDASGELAYQPLQLDLDGLQARALALRPDLQAARRSTTAATSQVALAQANGKQDPSLTIEWTHVNASNFAAVYFNVPLPIFNRNQGEILRTNSALTQSRILKQAAEQQVMKDVKTAYEDLLNSEEVVKLYDDGYLQLAQESLQIMQSSYQQETVSLIDFLDAQRSYRSTELDYRQALGAYMSALERLRLAVGTRELQRLVNRARSPH
jgi:outer membrane protein, heavy metal efflux system